VLSIISRLHATAHVHRGEPAAMELLPARATAITLDSIVLAFALPLMLRLARAAGRARAVPVRQRVLVSAHALEIS